jgi:predicted transcriptional regulator YdeE
MSGRQQSSSPASLRECPASTDAVIACTMKTIGDARHCIYGEWLPNSEYECGEPLPWYECYPGDSDGGPDSPVEVHVAVKRKGK